MKSQSAPRRVLDEKELDILPRLADDAAHARSLAEGLQALGFAVEPPQTNLLYFSLEPSTLGFSAADLVAACAARGLRFLVVPGSDPNRMRMVCHHQVDGEGVARALELIGQFAAEPELVAASLERKPAAAAAATSYAGGGADE